MEKGYRQAIQQVIEEFDKLKENLRLMEKHMTKAQSLMIRILEREESS